MRLHSEVMAGLIDRRFICPVGAARALFERHVEPWMGRFFIDLEQAKTPQILSVGRDYWSHLLSTSSVQEMSI